MSVQHKTLRDEILFVLGRANAPLDSGEIFERAKLADYTEQVSKALWALKDDEKVVRAPGDGRARYTLAEGQRAPAPAGKAGRSKAVQADDAQPAELPMIDLPPLSDIGHSLNGAAGKTRRANPENDISHVDVPNLADAMLAVSRDQLSSGAAYARRKSAPASKPRWWINQDGGLEIDAPDRIDPLVLNREQAQRMAAMVLGAHDALERASREQT